MRVLHRESEVRSQKSEWIPRQCESWAQGPMTLRLFLPALVSLLCAGILWGQADTAALSGRVTDPSGAVIPAAEVMLTNTATGVSSQTRTNDAGIYSFPSLPPGTYRLTVRAKGFQQVERAGLVLHVQDRVSQDIAMPVGSSEQTVVVTGDAAQANTESAAVGTAEKRPEEQRLPPQPRARGRKKVA